MKIIVTAIALFISSLSFSQSIIGKWKPVYITMDSLMRADIEQDTMYVNPAIKELFKNDQDPEASEQFMQMLFKALMKSMKETQEEYFDNGNYTETNSQTKRVKNGVYQFDKQNNSLKKTAAPMNKEQTFLIAWKNDQLVLTTELESSNGKKGKLKIVYKKL